MQQNNYKANILFVILPAMVITAFLTLSGCRGSDQPGSSKKNGRSYLKCADISPKIKSRTFSLPPLSMTRNGRDLKISGISTSVIKLGLLAGICDGTTLTRNNIQFFLDRFKAARVQAIAIAGGLGTTKKQIEDTLLMFADVPVPILLTPGAMESFPEFDKALKHIGTVHNQFIDMSRIRRVYMKHICIISLPGYTNPYYLAAGGQGCSYDNRDLDELKKLSSEDFTNVLLSPSPAKSSGLHAADSGLLAQNTGDPNLLEAMQDGNFKFGLHGFLYESGGNAVSIKDSSRVNPGIWTTSFLLQSGSAGATPVKHIDNGRHTGMAHIVEFSGNKGRYKTIYAP
jgi:hypothetical protein